MFKLSIPILTLLLGCYSPQGEARELVLTGSDVPGGAQYYNDLYKLDEEPWVTSVAYLDFDAQELADADFVTFPNGETYKMIEGYFADRDYFTFILVQTEMYTEAELTVDMAPGQNWVDGRVESADGTVFLVEEIPPELASQLGMEGQAMHLWIETTQALLRTTSEVSDYDELTPYSTGSADSGTADADNVVSISIKVYYTKEYARVTSNPRSKIDNIIAKSNQGFLQSGTGIKLDLICVEEYAGKELSETNMMLFRFAQNKKVFEDPNSLLGSADMAVLLVKELDTGGKAAGIGDTKAPFAVVPKRMAEMYYNFGHEVGHILGAGHDPLTLGNKKAKPAYAMGKLLDGGKYTIMAYDQPDHQIPINFYSGPNTVDKDGQVTGDAATADNVRVLRANRNKFTAIGDESQRCIPPASASTSALSG